VAGCCECGDEPSGSCATELVICEEEYLGLREQVTEAQIKLRNETHLVSCVVHVDGARLLV
jgi:hypothetical protein